MRLKPLILFLVLGSVLCGCVFLELKEEPCDDCDDGVAIPEYINEDEPQFYDDGIDEFGNPLPYDYENNDRARLNTWRGIHRG